MSKYQLEFVIFAWSGWSFFRFVTIHVFDGRTDVFVTAKTTLHRMQRIKNVTIKTKIQVTC